MNSNMTTMINVITKALVVSAFLFLAVTAFAITQDPYPFTSHKDAKRFSALTKQLRCVVCQNENIADSSAPIAMDMREKVYRMVLENKSDDDIKNFLAARYGDFILLQPRVNHLTWPLWVFPFAGMAVVFLVIIRRKSKITSA